jgi:signal transduction histidine kinase
VTYLFYARLIGLTAGTLVYLFLIALILGHRRPRRFERVLFFLVLSLFLIYAGGLLALNARIHYGTVPAEISHISAMLIGLSGFLLWPLTIHAHVEYASAVQGVRQKPIARTCVWLAYLIVLGEVLLLGAIALNHGLSLGSALRSVANFHALENLALSAGSAAWLQFSLLRDERSPSVKTLGKLLATVSSLLFVILIARLAYTETASPFLSDFMATATIVAGIFPGALLIYWALKHNFLEYGAQRNLVYALSATFLALLYLAFVRRLSGWLEPVLPPEATASVLLFVLIFLFEPLERVIGPALHRAHLERFGRVQKLAVELQEQARHGEVEKLIAYSERRMREEFGLAAARISIPRQPGQKPLEAPGGLGHAVQIPLMKDGQEIGLLEAATTGSFLTGETSAALEFLAEQLPAMVDLSRLIEEKVRLERELAERERLALLGQMAASVSHNLRNPLSSMKTVLQVQLENPEMPVDMRRDCSLVVGEIDRMSAKLTQLLRFAKPSVNGQRVALNALAKQTAELFRHDAERRNVRLEFEQPAEGICVFASEDALSELLSNLIVNAIEAQPNGGRVRVALARQAENVEISVEDDGPGISAELRSKIFQPFFTTKATGTGLGLSIVARRVAEMGGTLACESPVHEGGGTRFRLRLPLTERGEH